MRDKTVIVTGASDGIGLEAARQLKSRGATVVLVGRSPSKTRAAAKELDAKCYIADFAKLDDVRQLAASLKKDYPQIDVLVNNAGGVFAERQLTADGFEKTMQINHLAHFLLTTQLIDVLTASQATIINTSSVANKLFSNLDMDDLNLQKNYSANRAYGNAKLENILFSKELNRRYGSKGIASAAFHPGNVATNFGNEAKGLFRIMFQSPLKKLFRLISPAEGADTLVWLAATQPGRDWEPGEYYFKRKIIKADDKAYDAQLASALWNKSFEMLENDRQKTT